MDELAAADAIIKLVRANLPPGNFRGDTGEAVMYGTYTRAFRRFVRIRDLAQDGAGEEALILARSLLSMVARTIWVDLPSEKTERLARFNQWKKRELEDELKEMRGLEAVGAPIDFDFGDHEAQLLELDGLAEMPNDFDLLRSLRLTPYYERIYRPASSHLHYGLHLALDELIAAAKAGEDLPLEQASTDLAAEALSVSILTYAMFLDAAQGTVKHGITPQVAKVLVESPAFPDFPTPASFGTT